MTPEQKDMIRALLKLKGRRVFPRNTENIKGFPVYTGKYEQGNNEPGGSWYEYCVSVDLLLSTLQPFVFKREKEDFWRVDTDRLCDLAFGETESLTDYVELLEVAGMV